MERQNGKRQDNVNPGKPGGLPFCPNCFAFIETDTPVDCPWCGNGVTLGGYELPGIGSFIFKPTQETQCPK